MGRVKISILMPTYNDADTIIESLNSVKVQTFTDWEMIIVNDGSTDNTDQIVKNYIKTNKYEDKIHYFSQQNQDQLVALQNAVKYVNGEYIYFLHSDDVLYDSDTLKKMWTLTKNKNFDGFIQNILPEFCDDSSKILKTIKIREYKNTLKYLKSFPFNLGCNYYIDVVFAKTTIFKTKIFNNYLIWNRPFWANIEDCSVLNIKTANFPFFKYRVFEGNYINNELGKLNVVSGMFRTANETLDYYYYPFFWIQLFIYKVLSKLKMENLFYPISIKKQTKNRSRYVRWFFGKQFGKDFNKYAIIKALIGFYNNRTNRKISLSIPEDLKVYRGCDMREFNKLMLHNQLPKFYRDLLKEMETGFNNIRLENGDINKLKDILKFLCIEKEVSITYV